MLKVKDLVLAVTSIGNKYWILNR